MKKILGAFREFLRLETAGGVLLFIAAVVTMVVANSPLARVPRLDRNLRRR